MDYIEYNIQQGETLDSIAKKHNLSSEELLHFHNSKSGITQKIVSDYIPFHIKSLLVHPDNILTPVKIEQFPPTLHYNFPKNARYKIEIATSLYFMGKPISENKIESVWQINYNERDNSVLVEVQNKKHVKVDGQIKPLLEVIDKINKTTDVLHLELNEDKTLKNVINLDSVLQRWEKIKLEDLKIHELEDDYFKLIIDAYHQEFSTLSQSLEKNILYQIFFYPQGKISIPTNASQNIEENKQTISQLLPKQSIFYDLSYKTKMVANEIEVLCSASASKNWNKRVLEKEYKKNYAEILEDSFQFQFTLNSQYIHAKNGVLKNGKTFIKEQANAKLFYIGEYTITLLEEESNALKEEI